MTLLFFLSYPKFLVLTIQEHIRAELHTKCLLEEEMKDCKPLLKSQTYLTIDQGKYHT